VIPVLLIGAGGFLGAIARYLVDGRIATYAGGVLRGIEGFGAKQHLHTTRILSLSEDLPILIEAVDTEEKIRAILPELDEMLSDGLITLEKVEVITYRAGAGHDVE